MVKPYFSDHKIEIYCGDSTEILPELPNFDLLLTDPPYGLHKDWKRKWHGNNGVTRLWGEIPDWDKRPASEELIQCCLDKTGRAIIWGGNFYPVPPSRCWFVWDKLQSNRGADGELAWTNLDLAPKIFRMSRIDAYFNKAVFKKVHGAEKPLQLMRWCIAHVKPAPTSIIDPFMGTGNTLVAALEAGISVVGIDAVESYCAEAVRRVQVVING